MNNTLPIKLKNDALVETVMEIRFEPPQSLVPEILLGRLADSDDWRDFKQVSLPTAQIPATFRRTDANLRYQPVLELVSPDGSVSIRIGHQVIIYSNRGAYPGWDHFGVELEKTLRSLFSKIPDVKVSRMGLRYINGLRSDLHGINSIVDMDINVSLSGTQLLDSLNLNFRSSPYEDIQVTSRVATVDMAGGSIPENATVIVDIDVSTPPGYLSDDIEILSSWIAKAHNVEKQSFFKLLGETATNRLRDD